MLVERNQRQNPYPGRDKIWQPDCRIPTGCLSGRDGFYRHSIPQGYESKLNTRKYIT